ncbi:MAG: mandelate racemase, partial [Rubrivivax sp.]|nr:mandelate racemase [Rubrivivax sp.]
FQATPALDDLRQRTLLLEQPLPRAIALRTPIQGLGIEVPVILDESDDHDEALDEGLHLGYRGISSKACKGIYRSLRNAARLRTLPGTLLSGEDLTCQAGLAVQQDSLLAASLGVTHIERNGHHYVDGFGSAPPAEADAFCDAHPGLYTRDPHGRVHLRVAGGRLDLRSLHGAGFARAAEPRWDTLTTIT